VLPVLIPQADDLIPGPHEPAVPASEPDEWPDDEIFERYDDAARVRRARQGDPTTPSGPARPGYDAGLDVPSPAGHDTAASGRDHPDGRFPPAGRDAGFGDDDPDGMVPGFGARGASERREDTGRGGPVPAMYLPSARSGAARSAAELAYPIATTPPPGLLAPPRVPPTRRRRGGGAATLAVVAALVAITALVGAFVLATGSPDTPGPSPAPGGATPAASAPPPVTGLAVADERDRLRVTWSYPDGAAAAVVLSLAPAGEPMRAWQSLPAGAETVTVPGLDPRRDYCVTVTLAYSADVTVMSPPVCTDRGRSPAARP
jgi:hypothetical protein